ATVEVTLLDQYRRPVGSAVSSCSSAEASFASDKAKKKYGGAALDYRAALNDIVARAAKRAFVQAVIVAAAADEVFTAAEEVEEPAPAAPREKLRFPKSWKEVGGKSIEEVTDAQLAKIADWCRAHATNPDAVALGNAVTEEQESRRIEREGDDAQPVL